MRRSASILTSFGLTIGLVANLATAAVPPTVGTNPDQITQTNQGVRLSRAVPAGYRDPDVYLLPMLDVLPTLVVDELVLRNLLTGETLVTKDDEPIRAEMMKRFRIERFGLFRGLNTCLVKIENAGANLHQMQNWEIASYSISITRNDEQQENRTGLSRIQGLYRQMAEGLFPPGIAWENFERNSEGESLPGPTDWQPSPETNSGNPWYHFRTQSNGLVAIDAEWLEKLGVDPATISPSSVQIYRFGKQVPTILAGPEGVPFTQGARVLFYAEGNESSETAEATYYVTIHGNSADAARFAPGPSATKSGVRITSTLRETINEEDNQLQTRLGQFLSVGEMTWTWQELKPDELFDHPFNLPGFAPALNDEPTTATVELYFSQLNRRIDASLTMSIGGKEIGVYPVSSSTPRIDAIIPIGSLTELNNRLELKLTIPANDAPVPTIHLDRFSFQYIGMPKAVDGRVFVDQLPRNLESGADATLQVYGFGARRPLGIDLSDKDAPALLEVRRERGQWSAPVTVTSTPDFVFVDEASIAPAPEGEAVTWFDWSKRDYSADTIILYHSSFTNAAKKLKEQLTTRGQQVILADVESVYTAFSHGDLSSEGIRNFLAWAVNGWTGPQIPSAVVLIGDANGDGRGIAKNGVQNFIPVRQIGSTTGNKTNTFAADSFYSWLTPGDEATDLIVGRLSVSTEEEALNHLQNLADYTSTHTAPSAWANRVIAISDMKDFRSSVDHLLTTIQSNWMHVVRLDADDFPWEDNYYLPEHLVARAEDSKVAPLLTAAIEENFNTGAAHVTYFGHGAPNLWSNARFWFGGGTPNSDIIRLQNGPRLPMVTSFTCNNGVIDYPLKPWNICIAEDFMRHVGKGAIACLMPSGPGFQTNYETVAKGFLNAWLNDVRTTGILAEYLRISYRMRRGPDDHSRMFILLGDPTLSLAEPDHSIVAPPSDAPRNLTASLVMESITEKMEHDKGPDHFVYTVRVFNTNIQNIAEGSLTATLRDSNGVSLWSEAIPAIWEPNQRRYIEVTVPKPNAGFARLDIQLPDALGTGHAMDFPTTSRTMIVGDTNEPGPVALFPLDWLPAASTGSNLRIPLRLANGTPDSQTLQTRINVVYTDGHSTSTLASEISIGSGDVSPLTVNVPDSGAERIPKRVGLRVIDATNTTLQDFALLSDASELPDLAINPSSVRYTPESPTDGLTIFIDVSVTNHGKMRSLPTALAGKVIGSDGEEKALRNLVPMRQGYTIPSLNPGASWNQRLRWDPYQNSGLQKIKIILDPDQLTPDGNRKNNTHELQIPVRTKWKLVPEGIAMDSGKEMGTVELIARVTNTGESEARLVTVNFYRSHSQDEANKIGEVLLDVVAPGETRSATLVWQPEGRDLATGVVQPSYTMALKGSLQRVSSVAAP